MTQQEFVAYFVDAIQPMVIERPEFISFEDDGEQVNIFRFMIVMNDGGRVYANTCYGELDSELADYVVDKLKERARRAKQ